VLERVRRDQLELSLMTGRPTDNEVHLDGRIDRADVIIENPSS